MTEDCLRIKATISLLTALHVRRQHLSSQGHVKSAEQSLACPPISSPVSHVVRPASTVHRRHSRPTTSTSSNSLSIYQFLLLWRLVLALLVSLGRLARVKLCKNLAISRPPHTSLTLGLILFSDSFGKMRSKSQAISSDSKIVRASYAPWPTNSFSNLSRNSSESLSSADRASSPTTAFIDAASFPTAYLAY
jgi:hypothetical protein